MWKRNLAETEPVMETLKTLKTLIPIFYGIVVLTGAIWVIADTYLDTPESYLEPNGTFHDEL